jgi:hypothetical protein
MQIKNEDVVSLNENEKLSKKFSIDKSFSKFGNDKECLEDSKKKSNNSEDESKFSTRLGSNLKKEDSKNPPVYEILRQNTLYEEENWNLKKIIALETQIQHFQEKNSNEEERNQEKTIFKPKKHNKTLALTLSTRFGCFPCSTSNAWGHNTGGGGGGDIFEDVHLEYWESEEQCHKELKK